MKIIVFGTLGMLCAGCMGPANKIKPVAGFEVDRYLGTWYEIVRFPHVFEKDLINVTAEYGKGKKGRITVTNKGQREQTGEWTSIQGYATMASKDGSADLRVVFFWPFRGVYRVVALDTEEYRYALVISSNFDYLWILSRTPSLDQEIVNHLLGQAKEMGFDLSKVIHVKQTHCPIQTDPTPTPGP